MIFASYSERLMSGPQSGKSLYFLGRSSWYSPLPHASARRFEAAPLSQSPWRKTACRAHRVRVSVGGGATQGARPAACTSGRQAACRCSSRPVVVAGGAVEVVLDPQADQHRAVGGPPQPFGDLGQHGVERLLGGAAGVPGVLGVADRRDRRARAGRVEDPVGVELDRADVDVEQVGDLELLVGVREDNVRPISAVLLNELWVPIQGRFWIPTSEPRSYWSPSWRCTSEAR